VTINYRNILALKSEEIILTEELVFSEYSDVFEGTGCLPGVYRLETDPSVKPVVHPPRKIPIALRDKLKIELDRLTDRKIIVPVTEPTQWVNDLVIVEKSNSKPNLQLSDFVCVEILPVHNSIQMAYGTNEIYHKECKLNRDKLKFRRKEVSFVGHLLTSKGVCADPYKVKAYIVV
jgi:hypothetical protein